MRRRKIWILVEGADEEKENKEEYVDVSKGGRGIGGGRKEEEEEEYGKEGERRKTSRNRRWKEGRVRRGVGKGGGRKEEVVEE